MKRRGRPSVDPDGNPQRINTRVRQSTFDSLCRQALRARMELADFIRVVLDSKAAGEILSSKNRRPPETHPS